MILFAVPTFFAFLQDEAETATPRIEITGIDTSQPPLVRITANVYDEIGQPVTDLGAEAFNFGGELAETAELVSVENITNDDLPIGIVLAIDVSNSMSGSPITQAQAAARLFIQNIGENDPVAIVTFSNRARLVQDFTTDRDALLSAIDNIPFGGQTALYDGSLAAVLQAVNSPVSRRAMILLSDGAESDGLGGILSDSPRGDAIRTARVQGVPVYTIGQGFGVDRTYLQELAIQTNARYYESPSPTQLSEIYAEIARILRSQYILTYSIDLPLDGATYGFTLSATTASGETNIIESTLRAPVPVPVIDFGAVPVDPISEPTTFTVEILADDAITEVLVDGEAITLNDDNTFSFDIDPALIAPGEQSTSITVTDSTGDIVSNALTYSIAALPSVVTLTDDLTGVTLSEPTDLTLDITGQTAPLVVSVTVGDNVTIIEQAPYTFTVDPALLQPGDQTISVEVVNEGGVTSTTDFTVNIGALPPTITLEGIVAGDAYEGSFAPGESITLNVTADSQTDISSVAFTVDGDDAGTLTEAPFSVELDLLDLGTGSHTVDVTVTNAGGASATESVTFSVNVIPTPTPTFTPTNTPSNTPTATITPTPTVDVQATADAQATSDTLAVQMTSTSDAVATLDAEATGNAQATSDANATITQEALDAQATVDAVSTNDAQATSDANATITQEALDAQATVDAVSTNEAQATNDANATVTQEALDAQATVDAGATEIAQATNDVQATVDAQVTTEAASTLDAQATVDAQSTSDAQSTQDTGLVRNAQMTQNAQDRMDNLATLDAVATIDALATFEAEASEEAQATNNTLATADAQATLDAEPTEDADATQVAQLSVQQATEDAQATTDAQATLDAEPTDEPTDESPVATDTAEATDEATPTSEVAEQETAESITATPVEITEFEAQDAPADSSDSLPLIAIVMCGLGLLIFAVLFFVLRNRRAEA